MNGLQFLIIHNVRWDSEVMNDRCYWICLYRDSRYSSTHSISYWYDPSSTIHTSIREEQTSFSKTDIEDPITTLCHISLLTSLTYIQDWYTFLSNMLSYEGSSWFDQSIMMFSWLPLFVIIVSRVCLLVSVISLVINTVILRMLQLLNGYLEGMKKKSISW